MAASLKKSRMLEEGGKDGKLMRPAANRSMMVMGVDASLELREVKIGYIHTQYRQELQALGISVVCLESTHRPTFVYGKWLPRQFSRILS